MGSRNSIYTVSKYFCETFVNYKGEKNSNLTVYKPGSRLS